MELSARGGACCCGDEIVGIDVANRGLEIQVRDELRERLLHAVPGGQQGHGVGLLIRQKAQHRVEFLFG